MVFNYQSTSYPGSNMSVKFSDIIEKYNGEGDFIEWSDKLEMVASLQKIDDLANFLPLFLTGGAFSVYKGLSEETRKDFSKVKSALIDVFNHDKFTVYESLINRTLLISESVDAYLADLKRMMKLIGSETNLEYLKCAFVCGLPIEIKQQLKAACCLSEMTLELILQRTRALLKSKTFETCCVTRNVHVDRNGHSKSQVGRRIICYNCGKEGHTRNRCSLMWERRCFKCGEVGHMIGSYPKLMSEKDDQKNE